MIAGRVGFKDFSPHFILRRCIALGLGRARGSEILGENSLIQLVSSFYTFRLRPCMISPTCAPGLPARWHCTAAEQGTTACCAIERRMMAPGSFIR